MLKEGERMVDDESYKIIENSDANTDDDIRNKILML